jgi:carboxylate-amine ligase
MPNSAEEIVFKTGGSLTLGVEVELQIMDKNTLNLAPRADEILAKAKNIKNLHQEFFLSTVEICMI